MISFYVLRLTNLSFQCGDLVIHCIELLQSLFNWCEFTLDPSDLSFGSINLLLCLFQVTLQLREREREREREIEREQCRMTAREKNGISPLQLLLSVLTGASAQH